MRKYCVSHKNDPTPFMSEDEANEVASEQSLPGLKPMSMKVDSVSVKITLKNVNDYIGKFMRLAMKGRVPYVTETINLSQNLTWKGKGYIFENVSPYSELVVELCIDSSPHPTTLGCSKICLALLNLSQEHPLQTFQDCLRDENQNEVGELVLGYERVSRHHSRSCSLRLGKKEDLGDPLPPKKKRKLKSKSGSSGKSQGLAISEHRADKQKSIGMEASKAKSIIGSASIIRTKKYNGGNIIIGRAARFRPHDEDVPGPGPADYEITSSFERHVMPL
jgi:hypothetical protein